LPLWYRTGIKSPVYSGRYCLKEHLFGIIRCNCNLFIIFLFPVQTYIGHHMECASQKNYFYCKGQNISVLPRQNLVPELCRNVKSHMRELRYEVLPRKHRYSDFQHWDDIKRFLPQVPIGQLSA
jgi:hypothetical protein